MHTMIEQFRFRVRITWSWLRSGAPFWACAIGIPIVLWIARKLASNWTDAFTWAGTACEVLALVPLGFGLWQASNIDDEQSVRRRIQKWMKGFKAIFRPRVAHNASAKLTGLGATLRMGGLGTELAPQHLDVQKRLEHLERTQSETIAKMTVLDLRLQKVETDVPVLIEAETQKRVAEINRLQSLLIKFQTDGIGWAYASIGFAGIGTIMSNFAPWLSQLAEP